MPFPETGNAPPGSPPDSSAISPGISPADSPAISQAAPAILPALRESLREGGGGAPDTALLARFLEAILVFPPGTPVSCALADGMITEIDERLSVQVSAILHHERFRSLEISWRSLEFLVKRVDFRQNILIRYLSVSRNDLLADLDDAPDILLSGFYRHVYTAEYGQFGGQPVGAIIANYEFSARAPDIRLLSAAASVAAMAHAPFIAGAGKAFFTSGGWENFAALTDLRTLFEMPQYAPWRAFREAEDARYAVLTLPRFLLRLPYDPENYSARFAFTENRDSTDDLCWGNAAFALADRLADSFARYRWCVNIIGTEGGVVKRLPLYTMRAHIAEERIPVEVLISERREFELAEEGFAALAIRKGMDDALFFSANSCQRGKSFDDAAGAPGDSQAAINYKLSIQLPYMMIMNRLAHYLKVLQRENVGVWKTRLVLEAELNKWINQYVTEMDNPDPSTRSRRPLRMAAVHVEDMPNNPSWYRITILARPHFKFMGANFTLSLTGKLDRE
ncbi:MAG: type VI secretion system contractile sheath large subunit [Candidatus Accumulibacter sp.]|jgi:type VI secretion system protein ImpC|nr:type VI secretion system contractile sheath large subunit [Accumulibacter sp.]